MPVSVGVLVIRVATRNDARVVAGQFDAPISELEITLLSNVGDDAADDVDADAALGESIDRNRADRPDRVDIRAERAARPVPPWRRSVMRTKEKRSLGPNPNWSMSIWLVRSAHDSDVEVVDAVAADFDQHRFDLADFEDRPGRHDASPLPVK